MIMRDILINKLYEYLRENNPDVLMPLEDDGSVIQYLKNKVNAIKDLLEQLQKEDTPAYIIEEVCIDALTKDLKPSKFNYICSILEEDFETTYQQLQESGTRKYEVINMMALCKPVFESLGFTEEKENDRQLRYAVMGAISEYLVKNQ
jgi:hypothetical protein